MIAWTNVPCISIATASIASRFVRKSPSTRHAKHLVFPITGNVLDRRFCVDAVDRIVAMTVRERLFVSVKASNSTGAHPSFSASNRALDKPAALVPQLKRRMSDASDTTSQAVNTSIA